MLHTLVTLAFLVIPASLTLMAFRQMTQVQVQPVRVRADDASRHRRRPRPD
ncbi:hypothetical protein J3R73_000867 [Labrys monachus]|uniref:Uncharacterized protein n=1 Tax=Labrys monachus TaxID=217067 RepID=A0ABU0F8Y8_9HYPH|nr:hypothetical protein [Labrys monachus]